MVVLRNWKLCFLSRRVESRRLATSPPGGVCATPKKSLVGNSILSQQRAEAQKRFFERSIKCKKFTCLMKSNLFSISLPEKKSAARLEKYSTEWANEAARRRSRNFFGY
jgi:hypothetical protein